MCYHIHGPIIKVINKSKRGFIMASFTTKTKTKKDFRNPYIKRLERFEKYTNIETTDSSKKASYAGVGLKCGFFALFIFLGIFISYMLTSSGFVNGLSQSLAVDMHIVLLIALAAGLVFMIISGILAGRGKVLTIIFGSIFCTTIGFTVTTIATFVPKYGNHVMLALVLTAAIFFALLFTFVTGIIKVTNKFKSIVSTAFFGLIITALILFVSSFIPATRELSMFVLSNSLFSIGFTVCFIVIASCYLVFSFDGVKKVVENGVHKDAEWVAAFSVVFAVIWLFIEILSLLNKVDR